ncbi:MAG: hypothetical protein P1V13_21420 [Rhizobiaceae bacterium]|nr:hypothetical protein [Rhizobiaceae bacterium]
MAKKVMLVGWHPSVVNYDKWPGLTPEKLEAALRADEKKLNDLGYDAEIGFIYSGETATEQLEKTLKENAYDVVLIGAGVRKDDDHFLVFEKLVNIVHEHAPKARIAFNTGPTDSDVAVQRWARFKPDRTMGQVAGF